MVVLGGYKLLFSLDTVFWSKLARGSLKYSLRIETYLLDTRQGREYKPSEQAVRLANAGVEESYSLTTFSCQGNIASDPLAHGRRSTFGVRQA